MPSTPLRLLLCSALLLLVRVSLAAPGDLDASFGTAGKVVTPVNITLPGGQTVSTAFGQAVAVQSDGKIVVAGYFRQDSYRLAVFRYTSTGVLDTSFAGTGMVSLFSSTNTYPSSQASVAVQADGSILVAGEAALGGSERFALARLTSTGALDPAFNGTGMVTTAIGSKAFSQAMAVQADGKIVLAGSTRTGTRNDIAIVRYTSTGALDSAFGSTGIVTPALGSNDSNSASGVAVQPDGKIVVAGYTGASAGAHDFLLLRYTTTGTLDPSFHGTGMVTTDFGGPDFGTAVALQADGKIVVAGFTADIRSHDFALARYTGEGALDASFNGTGKVVTRLGSASEDFCHALALQADGKIVVAGETFQGRESARVALVRYRGNGTLDPTFNATGKVTTRVGKGGADGYGLALQPDGRILVVGGARRGSNQDIALLRYRNPQPQGAPVIDTTTVLANGAVFLDFGAPAVDAGITGGAASVAQDGQRQTLIYGGAAGEVLARTGQPDPAGATLTELGDPVFAGEALGFAGTAMQSASTLSPLLRLDFDARAFAVQPGGRLAALYSQLTLLAGIRRLAAQADPAPGGGQFAKFNSFGLPRSRAGLIFTANLHRDDAVTARNDYGIWREKAGGAGIDKLLRTGDSAGAHTIAQLTVLPPVPNATDQRLSFAPDGGVAALAKFDDGSAGLVAVAPDGAVTVPVDAASAVRDEAGNADTGIRFTAFAPPATANGGRLAFLATLRSLIGEQAAPSGHAIFSNRDGTLRRVLARGDSVPGLNGTRFGQLGQPLMSERGMIGLVAALTGAAPSSTRKAIVRIDGGVKTVAARLGEQAEGYAPGVVYRRFLSVVVTDSDPARVVFTAVVGGAGVNPGNNVGLWSFSADNQLSLLVQKGAFMALGADDTVKVRSFEALQAPRKSMGQGRSTDADGFVTAKATLSDGRKGVLRIPLP